MAILTGDFLFARASDLLADLGPEAVRIQARHVRAAVHGPDPRDGRPGRGRGPDRAPRERPGRQDRLADRHGRAVRRHDVRRRRRGRRDDGHVRRAHRCGLPARRRPGRHRQRARPVRQDPGHRPARGCCHARSPVRADLDRPRRCAPDRADVRTDPRRRGARRGAGPAARPSGPWACARRGAPVGRRGPLRPLRPCRPILPATPSRCSATTWSSGLVDGRRRPQRPAGRGRVRPDGLRPVGAVPPVLGVPRARDTHGGSGCAGGLLAGLPGPARQHAWGSGRPCAR